LSALPFWADSYISKKFPSDRAISKIKPGQRVFIGSACGEPQILVKELSKAYTGFSGLEVVRMLSHETTSLTEIANKTKDFSLNVRNIYLGSAVSPGIKENMRFVTPMNMSEVPGLFKSKKLSINVALIQVSPPDDFGWMSLGISVDVTLSAALSADFVIAQVNQNMPRILGQSFIHVNDIDIVVEHDQELLYVESADPTKEAQLIGEHIARLIDDGSTLQIGLDAASQATLQALSNKNDIGIHTQYLTEDVMHLYAKGVVNNSKKGFNEGKLVASSAIGSRNLYEFLHDNPAVDFYPSDYVNDPFVISRHNKMISMNVARRMDLTGQASAEASPRTRFAGVSGVPDFIRGAKSSLGGKSILMLFSTSDNGKTSNIIPELTEWSVVTRGDVHYVVTEYGVVNLFGKSIQERAMALISIAHPKFRDELFQTAKDINLISSDRSLGETINSIYPVKLERSIDIDGETITIRPAKTVDERRIQEHYYTLEKDDVFSRFFHDKASFGRSEVESKYRIDYIKDLTMVGVVGEIGFGKVIALGEYLLLVESNMAEVAFSVSKEYKGKKLGKLLMKLLAEAARENGISGLIAYTSPSNRAMIKLFHTLPYKVKTSFDGESISLSCRFDELDEVI